MSTCVFSNWHESKNQIRRHRCYFQWRFFFVNFGFIVSDVTCLVKISVFRAHFKCRLRLKYTVQLKIKLWWNHASNQTFGWGTAWFSLAADVIAEKLNFATSRFLRNSSLVTYCRPHRLSVSILCQCLLRSTNYTQSRHSSVTMWNFVFIRGQHSRGVIALRSVR